MGLLDKLRKIPHALAHPREHAWVLEDGVARVRGLLYRHGYRLLTRGRVNIGPGFVAECALHVRGPGRVTIGEACRIRRSNMQEPVIITLTPDARVEIGAHSTMGGLRVRCAERVTFGAQLLAAKTTVTDTDYGLSGEPVPGARPVEVGENCWLGVETSVCPGVRLGKNVVVSGGTVVTRDMPQDTMAMGNPARAVKLPRPAGAPGGTA